MCGITGVYSVNNAVDFKYLKRMSDILKHRGPDDEGFLAVNTSTGEYCSLIGSESSIEGQRVESFNQYANLGFGHRRLSILDLSASGHQPMSNRDGTLWIVYNGEVYNYIELKEELKILGYRFNSNTDTEVLLYAYEEWGEGCLNKLNGMWSFVIYDNRSKTLFASRDRFGKKPFYYYFDGSNFAFASEIKALFYCPFVKREPNDKIIYDYLVFNFLDHTEETFYKGIKQLEPGYSLVLKGNTLKFSNYYQLKFNPETGYFKELECRNYAEQLLSLLKDSVKLRLRSDVPVGTCLSGGIDSSTIVFIINNFLRQGGLNKNSVGEKQKTFSSCFEDLRFDERRYSNMVIANTQADGHCVFPSGVKLFEELKDLIWHQEEPFGSTSIYAQWNVMRLAKENGVKVLLDGQGADELLAGYIHYLPDYFCELVSKLRFKDALRESGGSYKKVFKYINNCLLRIVSGYFLTEAQKRSLRLRRCGISGLVNSDFYMTYKERNMGREIRAETPSLQKTLWRSEVKFGLKSLLKFEDRNSMAFSIEARAPFVDYRLVEFVFSLPGCYKIHHGWTKYILRKAIGDLVPEEIIWRKDKLGFPAPEHIWLSDNCSKVKEIFEGEDFKASNYIDRKAILRNLNSYFDRNRSGFSSLWRFINLELWLRRMF